MNTLHAQLNLVRKKHAVSWQLIEQDYLLSWILAGVAGTPELHNLLIFKGGTALKKTYFGAYRFSQDLDFSIINSLPDETVLEELIVSACNLAMSLRSVYDNPVIISCKKYIEQKPHPHNQKAFTISGQFPWHREPLTRVMVEISSQESILLSPIELPILHTEYNEIISGSLKVYRLEEICAEKIRAILEYASKLHERGWARSRARDYYDLWSILKQYKKNLDLYLLPEMVFKKCRSKNIIFSSPMDLFSKDLMTDLDRAWNRWLTPFVPNLPKKDIVLGELRHELEIIWRNPSQANQQKERTSSL